MKDITREINLDEIVRVQKMYEDIRVCEKKIVQIKWDLKTETNKLKIKKMKGQIYTNKDKMVEYRTLIRIAFRTWIEDARELNDFEIIESKINKEGLKILKILEIKKETN